MDTNEAKKFNALKQFFESDMRIKEMLVSLAPDSKDEYDEQSRMDYIDKLYKGLRDLKYEISRSVAGFEFGEDITKAIEKHFSKANEQLLETSYNNGCCQKLYQKLFSNMKPELVEKVKEECVGYVLLKEPLSTLMERATTINELLHVMHFSITNNENILESMPVINIKQNNQGCPIALYGEESDVSREIFENFPTELNDVGETDIVSMENKTLMMIRDRGHALTIDIDTSDKSGVMINYFVPKICNKKMVEALPGVNKGKITENGATGSFMVSKEELSTKLFDFIQNVPTDVDMLLFTSEEAKEIVVAPERNVSGIKMLWGKVAELVKGKNKLEPQKEENTNGRNDGY